MAEKTLTMPVVPLRGLVIFPHMTLHFDIGRESSVTAVQRALVSNQDIFLVGQKDVDMENPGGLDDLETVGTVGKVKHLLRMSPTSMRVLVEGVERGVVKDVRDMGTFLEADIEVPGGAEKDASAEAARSVAEAYMRRVREAYERFATATGRISAETLVEVSEEKDPGKFADLVAASFVSETADRQQVLNGVDVVERLETLATLIECRLQMLELDQRLSEQVRQQIDRQQRNYFLREQVKAIQAELGEGPTGDSDQDTINVLQEKIQQTPLPDEVRETANRELSRMAKMPPSAPEWNTVCTYLETVLDLPWGKKTEDNMELGHARRILNEDHYGLEKVKDRIIEFLAVRQLKADTKGPILCLAGPPGVGKTSIAKSVARALEREFVRMSLGGVRDEAEIRGHRRTYLGSMPGRVISSISRAGTLNPVFLFDEVDKMSHDFRGDPASAMLEVLDPETNTTFRDHYLDVDFDLSNVLFITTANDTDSIPAPLLDRMEIIRVDSYTDIEKLNIAKRHLISKQEEEHGLKKGTVRISDAVLMDIIHQYTSESGVRGLERQIGAIMRKAASLIVEHGRKTLTVTKKNLKDYLGLPKHTDGERVNKDTVGVVNGLAWTAAGGTTLTVEVSAMPGTGKLELTGQLGDVMKESAKTAISVVRGLSEKLDLPADQNEKTDLHIHVPEGAVPKDGPSAGVTMVTAIASALTGRPVNHEIAMTGEITLTGRVLKIGGVKEKLLAALRAGIHTIILPKDNRNDLEEIPQTVRKQMEFIFAETADDVLRSALKETVSAV